MTDRKENKCPYCGEELKYLTSWWYNTKCPPSGIRCSCENCGKAIDAIPETKFIMEKTK